MNLQNTHYLHEFSLLLTLVSINNLPYEKVGKNEPVCIADEVPFEIPKSWEWVRWGTLSESIQYGYNAPAQENGRIKMVRISDIQDNSVMWETVPYCDIKEGEIDAYLLKPNDILFARTGGTVGKSYLVQEVPEEAIYAGYLIRTRYSNQLCPQYLKYFMESELYWSQLREGTIATAQPNCNGKTLGNMLVPIPPSHEQIRIVEKLNAVMAHVIEYGTIDSRLKHLNNIFPERLKKSILQEAVQGKLVPQDPYDEPAAVLLEHIRAEKQKLVAEGKIKKDKHESVIFRRDNSHYEKLDGIERCIDNEMPFEIPDSWAWTSIGEVCSNIQYGSSQKSSSTGKIAVLRMGNLQNGRIVLDKLVYTSDLKEIEKYPLDYNDLLFNRTNSKELVGKVAIYKGEIPAIYAGYLVRIHPILIDSDYLNYVMQSQYYWIFCQNVRSDAIGQSNINAEKLKHFIFPLPPLQEQKRIVDKISRIISRVECL